MKKIFLILTTLALLPGAVCAQLQISSEDTDVQTALADGGKDAKLVMYCRKEAIPEGLTDYYFIKIRESGCPEEGKLYMLLLASRDLSHLASTDKEWGDKWFNYFADLNEKGKTKEIKSNLFSLLAGGYMNYDALAHMRRKIERSGSHSLKVAIGGALYSAFTEYNSFLEEISNDLTNTAEEEMKNRDDYDEERLYYRRWGFNFYRGISQNLKIKKSILISEMIEWYEDEQKKLGLKSEYVKRVTPPKEMTPQEVFKLFRDSLPEEAHPKKDRIYSHVPKKFSTIRSGEKK
ncbi:hypothetical protein Dip518_001188 [Parelusimicrobium proximum]|uniref:hypothetical protein n=1 Tax=Parelusimicrobium proximum TaxID=3228953 RepID=UPI003D16FA45